MEEVKIGDKVVCSNLERCEELKKGIQYTVSKISDFDGEKVLILKEFPFFAYSIDFFKKLKNNP